MGETPQGPDCSQGTDGNWYPPAARSSALDTSSPPLCFCGVLASGRCKACGRAICNSHSFTFNQCDTCANEAHRRDQLDQKAAFAARRRAEELHKESEAEARDEAIPKLVAELVHAGSPGAQSYVTFQWVQKRGKSKHVRATTTVWPVGEYKWGDAAMNAETFVTADGTVCLLNPDRRSFQDASDIKWGNDHYREILNRLRQIQSGQVHSEPTPFMPATLSAKESRTLEALSRELWRLEQVYPGGKGMPKKAQRERDRLRAKVQRIRPDTVWD